ncbi:MAG: FkbM family methyltransferase [Pirellulales bacterium]|nr:FkbM family methyltransferase [Pirellulales bacterium]
MSELYRLVRDKFLRRVRRRLQRWPAYALRGHRLLPGVIASGERAYRCAGGQIYLDIREKPWIRTIAIEAFERPKVHALAHFLRPGMTLVDAGANIGFFSLVAARCVGPTGRVLAVEPEPLNRARIARNVELNAYANIEIVQVALGDRNGEVTLHLATDHGHHSLLDCSPDRAGSTMLVPMQTLDVLLASRNIGRVDVLKIDVEGFEVEVLRGVAETIRSNPEIVILMDVHESLGVNAADVCGLIESYGLSTYEVRAPYSRPTSARWHPLELLAKRSTR